MKTFMTIVLVGLLGQSLAQDLATQSEAEQQQDPNLGERQYPIRDLPADSLRGNEILPQNTSIGLLRHISLILTKERMNYRLFIYH